MHEQRNSDQFRTAASQILHVNGKNIEKHGKVDGTED